MTAVTLSAGPSKPIISPQSPFRVGRIQTQVRRAFTAYLGRPLTTSELIRYAYPRQRHFEHWQYAHTRLAAQRYAVRIGVANNQRGRPILWGAETSQERRIICKITCACTGRWLRCLEWRIWSHRSRRLHILTKPGPHRPRREPCLYRSPCAEPAPIQALPSDLEAQRALADPVHLQDPVGLVAPVRLRDPVGLVAPVWVGRNPRLRVS